MGKGRGLNGAVYLPGRNAVRLPAEVYGYVKEVTISEAIKRGYYTEAEHVIRRLGRPKGAKSFQGRAYNQKDIKRLFEGFSEVFSVSIASTQTVAMQAIAKEMLSTVVEHRGKFNNYTGNLMNAYMATTVYGQKTMSHIFYDHPKNKILRTKNGKRYAMLQEPPGHTLTRKKRMRVERIGNKINRRRRYLRPYELNEGYRQFGFSGTSVAYMQRGTGSGLARSGIIIENTAPYADMVNRRYRVLEQASVKNGMNRWGKQFSKLVVVATNRMLKAYGLNISPYKTKNFNKSKKLKG